MSEGIARLKEIGAQRIYETTHISRANIDAIFTQSYAHMTKVQLFGFLTILEREYKIDLSGVRDDYLSRQDGKHSPATDPFTITEDPGSSGSGKSVLIIAALLLTGLIGFMVLQDGTATAPSAENTAVTEEIPIAAEPVETNITEAAAAVIPEIPEKPLVPEKLVIEPKAKLWMGFIDLKSLKRSQKMTAQSVEIDPSVNWLIVFGHGYVKVQVGDETLDFSEPDKLRLLYEEGQLRQISTEEFKARNRGDNW